MAAKANPTTLQRVAVLETETLNIKEDMGKLLKQVEGVQDSVAQYKLATELSLQRVSMSIDSLVEIIKKREITDKENIEKAEKQKTATVDKRVRMSDIMRNWILLLFAAYAFIDKIIEQVQKHTSP